jgi:sugar lactone lactonase YvrE
MLISLESARYPASAARRVALPFILSAGLFSSGLTSAQQWNVTTLAGQHGSKGTQDGTGASARFSDPRSLTVDPSGTIFVTDLNNDTIRRVSPDGTVTTFAGKAGASGYQDGKGQDARFSSPIAIASDNAGFLYVAELNCIRKVSPDAVVTTFAGQCNKSGFADGPANSALFDSAQALVVDGANNVFVAEFYVDYTYLGFGKLGNGVIRKISPDGNVALFAGQPKSPGSADGTGTAARFGGPRGITIDSQGNLYVADYQNSTIRKITPAARVTTVAGYSGITGSRDATGTSARFNGPSGVAVDAGGNVWVADTLNHSIRRISLAGDVTTPVGMSANGGFEDGTGSDARFYLPTGVDFSSSGILYVGDSGNSTVRKVVAAGSQPLQYWTLLPSSARSAGQNTFWTTDLLVFNGAQADATVAVKFFGHSGNGVSGPEQTFSLPPLGGRMIPDVLSTLFKLTENWGPLLIRSDVPGIIVQGQTATPSPTAGTFGQSVPAMTSADLLTATPRSLVGLREDALFRSNIILANADTSDATVRVSLLDSGGRSLKVSAVVVPASGMAQLSVRNDLQVFDKDFITAQLSLTSPSGSVVAYAAVIDNLSGDPRTILPR